VAVYKYAMPRTIAAYRMYPAIQSQPAELARLLEADEPIEAATNVVSTAARIFTIGIGTSSNAASIGASLLRDAGLDARSWSSHDLPTRRPSLKPMQRSSTPTAAASSSR